jgi:hypothetical protein
MIRRRCIILCACLLALSFALPAWAGSYLDRAALLLTEADHAGHLLRSRLSDKEFAHVVHDMSKVRLEVAAHMLVPKEIAVAHPHLLMALESHERAADAAEHGEHPSFLVHLQKATEEERILRSIIEQHGWSLPNI